jgi:hypothetical protein
LESIARKCGPPKREPVLAPTRQELPLGGESLNAMIGLVGHVDGAPFAQDDAAGHVEFPVGFASLAPLADELAGVGVDPHLVLHHERHVDQSVVVHGDAARLTGPALGRVPGEVEASQVFSAGGEFLQPGVVQVGDVDLILLVDGDADGRGELARFLPFVSPGQEELRLLRLTGGERPVAGDEQRRQRPGDHPHR